MRKSYQTEEYFNKAKPGTLVMKEQRHFLSSKMMDIEDEVRLDDSDISLKRLYLAKPVKAQQTSSELADYTKWDFVLQTNNILRDALYNRINSITDGDFTLINTDNLITKKKSDAILDYINKNLLRLYKLDKVLMWASYYDLSIRNVTLGTETINLLQYTPVFSIQVKGNDNATEKTFIMDNNNGTHTITYKQTKSSRFSTYIYYMDFVFVRI